MPAAAAATRRAPAGATRLSLVRQCHRTCLRLESDSVVGVAAAAAMWCWGWGIPVVIVLGVQRSGGRPERDRAHGLSQTRTGPDATGWDGIGHALPVAFRSDGAPCWQSFFVSSRRGADGGRQPSGRAHARRRAPHDIGRQCHHSLAACHESDGIGGLCRSRLLWRRRWRGGRLGAPLAPGLRDEDGERGHGAARRCGLRAGGLRNGRAAALQCSCRWPPCMGRDESAVPRLAARPHLRSGWTRNLTGTGRQRVD